MRATFPLMLAASLAVHLLVLGGAALATSFGAPKIFAPVDDKPPTLIFIHPQPVRPTSAPPAIAKHTDTHPTATSQPLATATLPKPPIPAPPPVKDAAPPVVAKTAPELNPNAHLPATAPEAVLAPVPAPKLDGTKGVVFILDISGSMYEPYAGATRLTYARQALSQRVRALPDGTPFAIVLYAKRACSSGPLVAANDATRDAAVRFLMRDVDCDGGTNLPAGLAAARALNTGALVLASDGDLNTSASRLMLQARTILGEPGTAPSILILGIAPRPGTNDDHLLQDLADLEGGTYTIEQTPADQTVQR